MLTPGTANEVADPPLQFRDDNGNGDGEILLNGAWIEADILDMDTYSATGLGAVVINNATYQIAREGGAP